MGVPKFFRFISERYPCLSEVVKEYEIPEYDNFYIDANGIIHNCSHPDDSPQFRITEREIFQDIFYYLEELFRIIRPKKLFFIAIDGVAPRAKMNQQRSRRFRTAKEAEKAEEEAKQKGEILPVTERFDSNCITPGTAFMERLHKQLQYYIQKKISTDDLWQKPKIILSGHNVPGEGEHKIMDYIRYLRSQSDWDPNTRHCLHGLDADLIMLGLCTHEPHFSLLREEVKFTRNAKKRTSVYETKFYLLHLSLMRDYLDLEFQELKEKLPFQYDLERIIDDWVLMGFLVGNDFIPNLPNFNIANNALHYLYRAYIEVLPTLDGYINNYGVLNLTRFEAYLTKLSLLDFVHFKDMYGDLQYFESKTGKSFPGAPVVSSELDDIDKEAVLLALETDRLLGLDSENEESDEDLEELHEEFLKNKVQFYKEKLEYNKVDSETLREQAEGYIRAIQWNLYYYYIGCPSWSWFYPHHYSPFVSDIKGFSGLDVFFEPSTPFLPFQQLLAVLPAASKSIVPKPFQDLMTSPESPIINFYPSNFETDLNGKKHEWEAVVKIPFIDEESLLSAMQPYYKDLSEDEKMRNSVKPMEIYSYTSESLGICEAPMYFDPIRDNHAQLTFLPAADIALKPSQVVKGRLPGAISGAYLGFPHLSGIPFTASLIPSKVKVFEYPSKDDNMILKVKKEPIEDDDQLKAIANELLDQTIFVGWPHIQRGKVTSILTEKHQFKASPDIRDFSKIVFGLDSEQLERTHKMTLGIHLDKVDIIAYVRTVEDKEYEFKGKKGITKYKWSKALQPFPYQTILRTAAHLDNDADVIGKEKNLDEIFTTGLEVFVLDEKHYGLFGKVVRITEENEVEVSINIMPTVDLSGILDISANTDLTYYPGGIAAQRLGMGSHLFSRVTGSIFIQNIENEEKLNVGLGLKFTKQGDELIGFTRREGNMWLYSEKTIALLNDYMAKFPELFEYLEKQTGNDVFFNKDVFPENTNEKVKEVKEWLKSQPHTLAERRQSGAKLLTNEAIKEVEKRAIQAYTNKTLTNKLVLISPSKLFIPTSYLRKAPPDDSVTIELLDRVIAVRKNHSIPIGLCGTIVGYERPSNTVDALYDIVFDEPVIGGKCLSCEDTRVYRLRYQAFIDISHGHRKFHKLSNLGRTKMENFTPNKDDWRSQWPRNISTNDKRNYQPSKSSNPSFQNIGNPKVKEFFEYINSEKVATPPNMNRMPPFIPNNRASNGRNELGADLEFQALWNVLQNHKTPEEKPLRPNIPLNEAVSPSIADPAVSIEQTNALRKLLKLPDSPSSSPGNDLQAGDLRPQVPMNQPQMIMARMPSQQVRHQTKSCGHIGCCSDLVQLCTNKNIPFPEYIYRSPSSGEFTCTVSFVSDHNYGNHVGDKCRTKEEAAESAACRAIRCILQKDEIRRPQIPSGIGYRLPHSSIRHTSPTIRGGSGLPIPPMQWCSSTRKQPMRVDNSNRRSPRGPTPPNNPVHQLQRPHFSNLNNHGAAGPNSNEKLSINPKALYDGVGNSDNRTPRPNNSQSNPRRGPGRSRPRIAANFSVPIAANKNNENP